VNPAIAGFLVVAAIELLPAVLLILLLSRG